MERIGLAAMAGAIAAFAVLLRARRQRLLPARPPACRACGFDLFGLPGASARCPECGADLSAPDATLTSRPHRRQAVIAFAVLILCLALALGDHFSLFDALQRQNTLRELGIVYRNHAP